MCLHGCGCALAVSDRTSEKEYFGHNAYYCDPADVRSILAAGTGVPQPHPAGDALVIDLPTSSTRPLTEYTPTPATKAVSS